MAMAIDVLVLLLSVWQLTQMVRDGATLSTKDDLSVVLGEFDLTSDSDEFDTNRFTGSLCFYHLSKNPILSGKMSD